MNEHKASMERQPVNIQSLVKVAIFLEGYKAGRGGNIQPLGNIDLEELWHIVAYLRGDV